MDTRVAPAFRWCASSSPPCRVLGRMIHEQADDQPCPQQGRHGAARRSGRLSGMIKRVTETSTRVLQIDSSAPCSRSHLTSRGMHRIRRIYCVKLTRIRNRALYRAPRQTHRHMVMPVSERSIVRRRHGSLQAALTSVLARERVFGRRELVLQWPDPVGRSREPALVFLMPA